MNRVLATTLRSAAAAGAPGICGMSLLVFAIAFYFSAYRPEYARLESMRNDIAAARGSASRNAADAMTPADRLAAFYGYFPASAHLPDLLDKIYRAADAQGLKLDQGEYRVVRNTLGRLTQFQIVLPVKGTYPQLRKFVTAALAGVPVLSLDSVQFERQKIGDSTVDAKVRLIVYLGQAS